MSKSAGPKAAKAKAPAKKAAAKPQGGKVHSASKAAGHVKNSKTAAAKTVGKAVAAKSSGSAKAAKTKASVSPPPRTAASAKPAPAKKSEGLKKKMPPRTKIADVVLPPGYRPDDNEPFMNEMHRAYFRKRLMDWKDEILRQTRETLAILHEDSTQHADLADRATSETDRATELRTRDRQRKLIAKIDAAIGRIEDGTYGYCEDTGEPIGLKRLDARPIATLSVEAQERHERRERVYREE